MEERPELGGVVRSQRADVDLFFLNDGHGHFTRVPMTGSRFLDENGAPLTTEPDFFTLAARFYDVNGDGAPDLYVCNDFEDPDQFWLNDGKGAFRLTPALSMRETSNTCMSVDFADVNRDGHVDMFTTDMRSATLAARQRQIATNTPLPKHVGLTKDRGQWMQNTMQLGRGDGVGAGGRHGGCRCGRLVMKRRGVSRRRPRRLRGPARCERPSLGHSRRRHVHAHRTEEGPVESRTGRVSATRRAERRASQSSVTSPSPT